jgi:hypothetical protein
VDGLRISFALGTVAAVLAALIARRTPAHRPVAAYLIWLAIADPALDATSQYLASSPASPEWARMAFRLEWSLRFAFPMLFVACAGTVLRMRALAWVAVGALVVLTAVTIDLSLVTGELLLRLYQIAAALELLLVWPCILLSALRGGWRPPGIAEAVILVLAANDVVQFLFPLAKLGAAAVGWDVVTYSNHLGFGVVCALQAWWLSRRPAR